MGSLINWGSFFFINTKAWIGFLKVLRMGAACYILFYLAKKILLKMLKYKLDPVDEAITGKLRL